MLELRATYLSSNRQSDPVSHKAIRTAIEQRVAQRRRYGRTAGSSPFFLDDPEKWNRTTDQSEPQSALAWCLVEPVIYILVVVIVSLVS